MARTVGSKNKNSNSLEFTYGFREYWGNPEKLEMVNRSLEDAIVNGGVRDALSAVTLIMKYVCVPLEKEVESDTAIETAQMNKIDIIEAIKNINKE